jgi:diguanylate cyclase
MDFGHLGLVKAFMANFGIMITFAYVVSLLHKHAFYRVTRELKYKFFILSCIGAGWISMLFGATVEPNVILDLRFIPIIIAPMFISSSWPIIGIALGIGVGRLLFGVTMAAWIGFIIIMALGFVAIAVNSWLRRTTWGFTKKMGISIAAINLAFILMNVFIGVIDDHVFLMKIAPIVFPLSLLISGFFVFIIKDFQSEFIRRASLVEEASRDHLTKLYNVRTFDRYYQELMERASKDQYLVSLAFIDIDHFKQINDTYGHAAGDMVIRKVAETIANDIRWEDFVARYGGEEFVVLLPGKDAQDALDIMERVRESVAEQTVKFQKHQISVTISIGIATFPYTSSEDLMDAADKALYQAKANGRNQCFIAEPLQVAFEL